MTPSYAQPTRNIALMIGRVYCPTCDAVRSVVWPEDVTEIRCLKCETLTTVACGDEERNPAMNRRAIVCSVQA